MIYKVVTNLTVLWFIIASPIATAQGRRTKDVPLLPSKESQTAVIRKSFEAEIQSVLNKYLKTHQYAIDVRFKMIENDRNIADVPYAPDSILPDSYQGLPKSDQLKKLKDLSVTIMVPKWMDSSTKATLKSLLTRRLENITGSALKLEIEAVSLNVDEPPKPQQVITSSPQGTSSPAIQRQQQADLDLITRKWQQERDDLKREWQAERRELKEQLKDLQKKIASADKPTLPSQGAPPPTKSGFEEFWEFARSNPLGAGLIVLLIYIAVFTLAFLPARSMSTGMGGVQNAFSAVANSIKGVGDSIGKSSGVSYAPMAERSDANPSSAVSRPDGGAAQSGASSQNKAGGPSYPEIKQISLDIQKNHDTQWDPMVSEMIQEYLSQDTMSFRAILLLEILGPLHAERIYNQLNLPQKDTILRLLRTANRAASNKPEHMYEVAATYQTKIIAFRWNANLNKNISRILTSLSIEEKVNLVRTMSSDNVRQRFMLYLDVGDLSEVLKILKQKSEEKDMALRCLAAMPRARDARDFDQEIEAIVSKVAKNKEQDYYLPYLNHFEFLIENSGDDLAEDILDSIKNVNPKVGQQLRKRVVTLSELFRFPAQMRREILAAFNNSELAALVSSFNEDRKNLVMNDIDQRRQELILEQIQMLGEEDKTALAEKRRLLTLRLKKAIAARRTELDSQDIEEAHDDLEAGQGAEVNELSLATEPPPPVPIKAA